MRLKQKVFFVGAVIPAISAGLSAVDIGVQMKNGSEQQDQADAAEARDRQITSQLKKIANNPTPQGQAAGSVMQQRGYASIGGFFNTAKGLAKDAWTVAKAYKKPIALSVMTGTGMGAAGYAADKAIQMNENRLADKKGEERQFSIGSFVKSGWQLVKTTVKENPKTLIGGSLAFGAAMPAVQYGMTKLKENQVQKSVMAPPPEPAGTKQQQYSFFGGSLAGFGKRALNTVSNFMGGGGFKGVASLGRKVSEVGAKSGNEVTQKVGTWIRDHPKTAVAASVPVGLGIMGTTLDLGSKPIESAVKLVDKKAFAYQNSQNQVIQ